MARKKQSIGLNDPLRHTDHRRPVTRREMIAQGFKTGTATLLGTSMLGTFANRALAIDPDFQNSAFYDAATCKLGLSGGRKIPFICFDLAGGANFAGSNVLVGGPGGQRDSLSTAGYSKQGLPPDILPDAVNPNATTNDFIDDSLGLLFHSESAILQGIRQSASTAVGNTNGAVIPARSENDTGNNPHNPMYGIYKAGLQGSVLNLIGSRNSESGGNSMAPAMMLDPEARPTKVDRPEDTTGLVDVGDLGTVLPDPDSSDVVAVMEQMRRITDAKLSAVNTLLPGNPSDPDPDLRLKKRLYCEYLRSAHTLERFADPSSLDVLADPFIVDDVDGIFTRAEFDGDREFRKAASVMKLVVDGIAGCGTITMGGYDYHTGDRRTGEARDLRAGRCIGACLEYAARRNTPIMIYVFSDGSVFSNGMIDPMDTAALGIEKSVWTADNQSTASPFYLVYDPVAQPTVMNQQIGFMRPSGDVETSATPGASNVNLLVETVILNYMALHGEEGLFDTASFFPGHGMGSGTARDSLLGFGQLPSITGGTIA